jgi:hypothetical protein
VADCCSAPSRISRACAATVFFSLARESAEAIARGFAFGFFGVFFEVVFTVQKTRLGLGLVAKSILNGLDDPVRKISAVCRIDTYSTG